MVNVVGKDEVKPYLAMVQTDNDALIESVIAQAEAVVVRKCGPLTATALTKRVFARGGFLMLPVLPVISVTSVTAVDSGAVLDISDEDDVNLSAGIISVGGLCDGVAYDVVYQAGYASLPADLERAVIEMCRYLWRPQRGSGARGGDPDQMASLRLAEMLMTPYMTPGFA